MELFLRILSYLLVGVVLIIANIWFIKSVHQAFFGRAVVIAPFRVGGTTDVSGASLAQMLQSKLRQLQRQLEMSQQSIVTDRQHDLDPQAASLVNDPRARVMLLSPVALPTAVLEPLNINVKVGGVEVGGVFSWLQRAVVRPRTLTLTAFIQGETAVVTGDLEAFGYFKSADLWLETAAAADQIATIVAYALLQRKLAAGGLKEVEALTPAEFGDLLQALFTLGELNRRVASGRAATDGFSELLEKLEKLTDRVPEWYELVYLAARVGDQAGQSDRALLHYLRLRELEEEGKVTNVSDELRMIVARKLEELSPQVAAAPAAAQRVFVESMSRYAAALGLPGPGPEVAFRQLEHGALAIWNEEQKRYEVDPRTADFPGNDRYVALMGRFMLKHYGRCFGPEAQTPPRALELWQELRSSLVEYIISTDPDSPGKSDHRAYAMSLFRRMQQLDADPRIDRVTSRKVALQMLNEYDCDWTLENLAQKVQSLSESLGLTAESREAIEDAFGA